MMKKDGHNMYSDYDDTTKVNILVHNKFQWVKLDDLIKWLKVNRPNADQIEVDWLIKVLVRLKNTK